MKERRITFYRMAKDMGIDRGSLYKSLKDSSNPELNTMMKVLDYLSYDIRLVERKKEGGK
jgi:probable addiction module antidote protein